MQPKQNIKSIKGETKKQRWLLYQKLFLDKEEDAALTGEKINLIQLLELDREEIK